MSAALGFGKTAWWSRDEVARLRYVVVPPRAHPGFQAAALEGLQQDQKSIPSRFLYDEVGSALFEAITRLHEYYLTRKERSILETAAVQIVAAVGKKIEMVEFGSGSAEKTRLLLNAALSSQENLRFVPIDISQPALQSSAINLLNEHAGLDVVAIAAEYRDALQVLPPASSPRLLLFLGSNIGNFTPEDAQSFLSEIGKQMHPDDRLLIGVDLVKDASIIELAYNDPAGVTSAFNKNVLARVNRELKGEFNLDCFSHHVVYVPDAQKIEMRLVSRGTQWVRVGGLKGSLRFKADEYIHTEDSHKYSLEGFGAMACRAGLEMIERWTDEEKWFALTLLKKS
jgi:L-histidine Nalpha-methyltransferase